MSSFVPILLGILLCLLGNANRKGNIASLHWYHRRRVTEENRLPFGRLVGWGTICCGISIILYGGLTIAAEAADLPVLITVGSALLLVGLAVGLFLNFYAMIKYNKGIF